MENERKIKIISLVAVIVAVIGLTVAFAAMSRTLKIKGSSNIDPANFDIHFKNVTFKEKTPTASTSGTPTPTNNDKGPTIDNIRVTLSQPNDYVIYTADIENEGDIDAEINNITLPTLTNEQKELFEFSVVYTNNGEAPKKGDMLAHGEVRNITITFRYKDITDENLLPDSPKTIDLSYSIEYVQASKEVTTTSATTYNVGDKFCLNDDKECFYVISDNGNTVTALSEWNLNTSTNKQESLNDNKIAFSEEFTDGGYPYWDNNNEIKPSYGNSYPAWVYDSNSNLWTPIQNYQTYLRDTLGKTSATATLLSYEQAQTLGCSDGSCESAPSFVYQTMYWLGTAEDGASVWVIGVDNGFYSDNYYFDDYGIRPVITINKSEL